jgi:N-methylhydantoinase B
MPDRLVGDLKGASNITSISGPHRDGRGSFLFVEFPAGGTGGTARNDGNNAVRNFAEGDISSIQPVEALEASCPLQVERMILRTDAGGAGMQRGGLGLQREIRVLGERAALSVLSDKNVIPPYGVRGGGTGAPNRFTVRRDGEEIEPSAQPGKITGFALRTGDVVVERTAGGGGYGDPIARDPALVVEDVRFGYVSAQAAADAYGVVLHDGRVDVDATRELRARLAGQRVTLHARIMDEEDRGDAGHAPSSGAGVGAAALARGSDDAASARRFVVHVPPEAARQLSIADGDLVDLPRNDGPSLLAWARVRDALDAHTCGVPAWAAALLALRDGEHITLRRLPDRRAFAS